MDLHSDHDLDREAEGPGKEEARFGELASENQKPKDNRSNMILLLERRVVGGECLASELLARLASYAITKHSTGRHDCEKNRGMIHKISDSEPPLPLCSTTGEMRGIVPSRGDIREFSECSKDHDQRSNGSSKSGGRPCHGRR